MCDHSHSCGGACDHSADVDQSSLFSLYKLIDTTNVQCLNETIDGSGAKVFKPYDKRKELDTYVMSDTDPELLFNIPFTGTVRLKSIVIAGFPDEDTHPKDVALYLDEKYMSFDTNKAPTKILSVTKDPEGSIEYPLEPSKFGSCSHLSIYVKSNFGAEFTKIHYIGLKGDFMGAIRQEVVITNYESAPNVADHKTDMLNKNCHLIN